MTRKTRASRGNWTADVVSLLQSKFLEDTGGRGALSGETVGRRGLSPKSAPDTPARGGAQSARPEDRASSERVKRSDSRAGGRAVFTPPHYVHRLGLRADDETSVSRAVTRNVAFSACPQTDRPNQGTNENGAIDCAYLKNCELWDVTLS